jgi:hypothetical protein
MTDLVNRLKFEWDIDNSGPLVSMSPPEHYRLRLQAAARIEELEAENKMLKQANSRHSYNSADDDERKKFDDEVRQEMQALGIVN